jgi:hypothetical protein
MTFVSLVGDVLDVESTRPARSARRTLVDDRALGLKTGTVEGGRAAGECARVEAKRWRSTSKKEGRRRGDARGRDFFLLFSAEFSPLQSGL